MSDHTLETFRRITGGVGNERCESEINVFLSIRAGIDCIRKEYSSSQSVRDILQ